MDSEIATDLNVLYCVQLIDDEEEDDGNNIDPGFDDEDIKDFKKYQLQSNTPPQIVSMCHVPSGRILVGIRSRPFCLSDLCNCYSHPSARHVK